MAAVSLWDVNGIEFNDCVFENTSNYSNIIGISALDAGFIVNDDCEPSNGCYLCNNITTKSKFSGFYLPIFASATGSQVPVLIANTNFEKFLCGIEIDVLNYYNILQNKFNFHPHYLTNRAGYGIYNYATSGYYIEENKFINPNFLDVAGIAINNSGIANNIMRLNEFSSCYIGYYPLNINGYNLGTGSGLQLTCNKFQSCFFDIASPGYNSPYYNILHPLQGSAKQGADNEFISTYYSSIYTGNPMNYYLSYGAYKFPYYPTSGITVYYNAGLNDCSSLNCLSSRGGESSRGSALRLYSELQSEYDDLSSDLSDNNNSRTTSREDAHELSNLMMELSNRNINKILSDTILDLEQLKLWYEAVRTPISKYSLAETYFMEKRYDDANRILASIPSQFNFSEEDNYEHANYMRFHSLKNDLARSERLWNELNDRELTSLRNIRETTTGRSSAMANGVLCFFYKDCMERTIELPRFEDAAQTKSAPLAGSDVARNVSTIYVYPNPTTNFVDIISLNPEVAILNCEIFNVVSIKVAEIVNTTTNVKIDMSGFDNGVYFIKVKLSNGDVENIKIVKI